MKKKYAISTGGNMEISAAIQTKLFSLGYGWFNGEGKKADVLSAKWLFIYLKDGDLTHGYGNTEGVDELTMHDIFQDNTKIKRAIPKEMTLPEIIKELGYEVKIVK